MWNTNKALHVGPVPLCGSLCEPPGSSWWWAQHSSWSGPAGSSESPSADAGPGLGWCAGGGGNQFMHTFRVWFPACYAQWESIINTLHKQGRELTYIFIAQRLQQEEQDGLEVFVPHGQAVLPCDLQQLHQSAFALLGALVVIGEFLQQVGDQVRVVVTDC